jgi:hypothetical protein
MSEEKRMKPFLLIGGYNYYPCSGTGDWIGTFSTYEEAEDAVKAIQASNKISSRVDWYDIIDLREWIMDDDDETNR